MLSEHARTYTYVLSSHATRVSSARTVHAREVRLGEGRKPTTRTHTHTYFRSVRVKTAFYANTRISALTLDNFRSHGRLQIRSSTRPSPLERPPLEVRYCSIPLCRRTVFPSPRRRPRVAYLCRAATNEHALVEPRLPRSPTPTPTGRRPAIELRLVLIRLSH